MTSLRLVIRRLARRPSYLLFVVGTLALGIGVAISIFQVVDTFLLNPLPFPESSQLVFLSETDPTFGTTPISYSDYLDWRARQKGFQDLAGYLNESMTLTGGERPERIGVTSVTASFFKVLGIPPLFGRFFAEQEDKEEGPRIAVLSGNFWASHFGSNSEVIGKTILLDKDVYEIVGVTPRWLIFPDESDVYIPLGLEASNAGFRDRGAHAVRGIGRLGPGVTLQKAKDNLAGIAKDLEDQFPETNQGIGVAATSLPARASAGYREPMQALAIAAALVLLIASANASALILARRIALERETSIQIALGAPPKIILFESLMETFLLTLFGALLGLGLAILWRKLMPSLAAFPLERVEEVAGTYKLAAFIGVVIVFGSILLALAPSSFIIRGDLHGHLKEAGSGWSASAGRRARRFRALIIIAEVAMTTMLLISSGLLISNFLRLRELKLGFDPENLLTFQISLSETGYSSTAAQLAFFDELRSRLRRLPQVQNVATSGNPPFGDHDLRLEFSIYGKGALSRQKHLADAAPVSPGYLETMRIPLLKGRDFNEADVIGRPAVAVIDKALARTYWPHEDPIGKQFNEIWDETGGKISVIGVVGTVRHQELVSGADLPQIYYPNRQYPSPVTTMLLRTSVSPLSLAETCRKVVKEIDPDQPIYNIRTMKQSLASTLGPLRLMTSVVGSFAVIALLLAALGVYSLLSFSIEQRKREIGIRLALGGSRAAVLRLFLKENMILVVAGAIFGNLAVIVLGRTVGRQFNGISWDDPASFLVGVVLILLVSLLASYLCLRRIFALDPAEVLREN